MSRSDTIKHTFIVAIVLCLVCAVLVSTAAVMLRPMQIENQQEDIRRNILAVAGLLDPGKDVATQFEALVTPRMVDLESGTFTDEVNSANYDQLKAARDPQLSTALSDREDIAGITRREDYAEVFLVEGEDGELSTIILPIRGYGLWGTLYGFLALEAESYQVVGLRYYDHQETPGLGGEVDNPRWRDQWEGKRIYDEELDQVQISLVKGDVQPNNPNADYQVQGLTGATLTTRGVQNMLDFWMGEQGFAEFLRNLKAGEA